MQSVSHDNAQISPLYPKVVDQTCQVTWEKVRSLLANHPLQQLHIDQIILLEEQLMPTRRHTQMIIALLIKRGEENPEYFPFALQMAATMEYRIHRAWKRIIEKKMNDPTKKQL